MKKIITIDGPAASGKSTLCQELCQKLEGWDWLSSGVFYRGLAFMILDQGLKEKTEDEWQACLESSSWEVQKDRSRTIFIYNNRDLKSEIYTAELDQMASDVAQSPKVRQALRPYQREQKIEGRGLIAEGRDCGTAVFIEAPLKIYLDAHPEIRSQRRAQQRGESPQKVQLDQETRDKNDRERPLNPLKKAEDAWVINTNNKTHLEVVGLVYQKVLDIFSNSN